LHLNDGNTEEQNVTRTFDQWMQEVNRAMDALCGMVSEDLPDWNYRDAYDDGVGPRIAAARAVRAARDF
jgi:hypothetical protein